jgi:hypothetical protein
MTNSVMASGLPSVSSGRKRLYRVSFLVFFIAVWVTIYSLVQTKYYNSLSSKEQEQITKLNNDIASAQKDERYLKFSVAKNIVAQNTVVWRWDRLSRILNVFGKLQQLGWSNIRFSDFTLDYEALSLKWTVSDLKIVYGSWWVIDTFNALEFLDEITIPSYKKTEEWFTFSLTAKVLLKNVWN